ncbi:tail fiber domain-containing protein [Bacillus thuringiensis]|uniref:tail fiber domain-containing protein n=1 Tax=Bacillus thuringiensis TaxID=1428 RepID=UPI003459D77D
MAVITQGQITLFEVYDGQKGDKGDKGDTGAQGLQGIAGAKGADGITYYTWIKYADTPTSGMSDLPTGKSYMGIAYNKLTATESTNYNDYSWSLIKGDKGDTGERGLQGLQGDKGDQGIQGVKGADGKSSYTHIAYATNSTGTAGFSVSDPVGKTYIGMYVDQTATDSTDPTKYKWTLIKGADGAQGIQGQAGADGKTPYFHTAYANNSTGTIGFSTTDATGRTFIGTYTDFTSADSTDPSKYTWVLIKGDKGDKGDQGVQGIQGVAGKDGTTTYTWVKYATSAAGANMSDLPDGKTYIGLAYNKTTPVESTVATDYQWALIKGDKGDTGLTGSAGIDGKDGATYYTWLKYADTPTTGMSDDPTNKTYMGIAYNKTTATESTNYADYSWSLIKGAKGDQGLQGIPGAKGADGQTTYTWVKYADDELGNGMADLPDGKRYLGLAFNKTTATESTNKADYQWSPLYDNVDIGGRNYLPNSGFTKTSASGKTTSKHPDLYADGWGGYNGGITNPTTSYHAHIDNTTFAFPVYEFNESDGTRNWKGVSPVLTGLVSTSGEYHVSFNAFATGAGTKLFGGFYYTQKGGTNATFYSGQYTITNIPVNTWGRVDAKVMLNDDCDFTKPIWFYVYGYGFSTNSILYMCKPQLEKGNVASDYAVSPEDVQAGIDSALNAISDMASDSKLTSIEKHTLKNDWDIIVAEKPTLEGQATTYGITTEKTNFTTAYNTLSTYITPLLADINSTSAVDGATLRTNFKNYFDKKALLQRKITDTAKGIIDNKIDTTAIQPTMDAVAGWTIGQINGKPALNGDMIQKDTILAGKLAVGNFENLFTNGSGEYGNIGWEANNGQWSVVNDSATAYSGAYYLKCAHGSTGNSDFLDLNQIHVRGGEQYYFEGYFKFATAGTAFNTRTFLIKWFDKAGAVTWTVAYGNLTAAWQKFTYVATVPATAVKMQIGVSVVANLTAGNSTYADSLFCKKMLTGELVVDGTITAAKINVNDLVAQTAFINAVKATDISGDHIKGGTISGVTYQSINASNPKIKAVIEGNTVKSYGASDGTKQNYSELKEGGVSVFQMAENGSPFGDRKAYVEPARFNAVQGSSYSVALEPTELRFWVPNMTGTLSYDVVGNGASGYGLRLESNGGVLVKNKSNINEPALQFENGESIFFDGWGNMQAGTSSTQYATWSIKDADKRLRMLIPMGKGTQAGNEYHSQIGGHKFFHNGNLGVALWTKSADESLVQFSGNANFKYWKGGNYFECKNAGDNGYIQIYASAFNTASSLVWKENITNFEESALEVIMSADVMTYQYKQEQLEPMEAIEQGVTIEEKEGHTHVGIIAEYAPELVKSQDGKGVDNYAMVSLAWKAIQELTAQINELKAEITLLKAPTTETIN